jgi:hypothetical protein
MAVGDRAELRRAELLAGVPVSVRSVVQKSFEGSASPRQAIKAMCLTCAHFDREEIRSCRVFSCALWRYRPFQSGKGDGAEPHRG